MNLTESFVGFTYNGIHSSSFGIVRYNTSNRFEDKLAPTMKDTTIDKSGQNGAYYFGTKHTKKEFTVNFAFHNITEEQKQLMTLLWNDGELHELIFDETPYKVYMAKITGNSMFKEIPFVREGIRYYSGEGSFNFTCMSPYAHSRYNYLENAEIDESYAIIHYDTLGVIDSVDGSAQLFISEEDLSEWYYNVDSVPNAPESITINNVSGCIDLIYQNTELSNVHEWQDSGVIPSSKQGIGYLNNGKYIINNTGDLSMPIKIWYDITTATSFSIKINDELIELSIPTKELEELKNHYLVVDTYTGTVERYTQDGKQTGKLYNKYLTNYNILHTLPCGMNTLTFDGQIPIMLEYKYLYY